MKDPLAPSRTKNPRRAQGDHSVRMTATDLAETHLWHLETRDAPLLLDDAKTLGYCVSRAGTTEWMGSFQGQIVTLAWDWMQDERGSLRRLGLRPPRSNILVLAPDQAPLGHAAESLLWAVVKRHQWRKVVADRLMGQARSELLLRTEELARVLRPVAAREDRDDAADGQRLPAITLH